MNWRNPRRVTRSKVANRRNPAAIKKSLISSSPYSSSHLSTWLCLSPISRSVNSLFLFLFSSLSKASGINKRFYKVEENLPHLVRNVLLRELEERDEPARKQPSRKRSNRRVRRCHVLIYGRRGRSSGGRFRTRERRFVAFVGQSGAGKSTIAPVASYDEPTSGEDDGKADRSRPNGYPSTYRSPLSLERPFGW